MLLHLFKIVRKLHKPKFFSDFHDFFVEQPAHAHLDVEYF